MTLSVFCTTQSRSELIKTDSIKQFHQTSRSVHEGNEKETETKMFNEVIKIIETSELWIKQPVFEIKLKLISFKVKPSSKAMFIKKLKQMGYRWRF